MFFKSHSSSRNVSRASPRAPDRGSRRSPPQPREVSRQKKKSSGSFPEGYTGAGVASGGKAAVWSRLFQIRDAARTPLVVALLRRRSLARFLQSLLSPGSSGGPLPETLRGGEAPLDSSARNAAVGSGKRGSAVECQRVANGRVSPGG